MCVCVNSRVDIVIYDVKYITYRWNASVIIIIIIDEYYFNVTQRTSVVASIDFKLLFYGVFASDPLYVCRILYTTSNVFKRRETIRLCVRHKNGFITRSLVFTIYY